MKILCLTYTANGSITTVVKPDTALLNGNKPFFVPHYAAEVRATPRLALRIGKMGRNIAERFAMRYIDGVGIGIDIAARNLLANAMRNGLPWSEACAFDGSAPISAMMPAQKLMTQAGAKQEEMENGGDTDRELKNDGALFNVEMTVNGNTPTHGQFTLGNIVNAVIHASRYFTLHTGDYILCPTYVKPLELNINDHIDATLNGDKIMSFNVK